MPTPKPYPLKIHPPFANAASPTQPLRSFANAASQTHHLADSHPPKPFFFLLFLFFTITLSAQTDSLPVDRDFQFADGVYASLQALRANRPTYALARLDGRTVLQRDAYQLKVERLFPKGRPDLRLRMDTIAAVVIEGLPYIRVAHDTAFDYTTYAGLQIRGRLCYYAYDTVAYDSVLIQAYNPATGRPFRQQRILRPKTISRERILDLANGTTHELSEATLRRLLRDDAQLLQSMDGLDQNELNDRLLRLLLIYDDRNPLRLPRAPD